MKITFILSVLWFLFWGIAGWAEEDLLWGLLFGVFPNLVVWGFWAISIAPRADEDAAFAAHLNAIKKMDIPEKRKFARLEYPSFKRPSLNWGEHRFEIANISERGLKIINDKKMRFDRYMQGEVNLLSGKRIQVEGEVSWSLNNEMGLLLVIIPASVISEEKQTLSKRYPDAMKLQ